MKNVLESEICDQSRRKILKKSYTTPVVVALGTMTLYSPAEAMSKRGGSSSSAGNTELSKSSPMNQVEYTDVYQEKGGSSSLIPR